MRSADSAGRSDRPDSERPVAHRDPERIVPSVEQTTPIRARHDPTTLTPAGLLYLQRTIGNRAVAKLLPPGRRRNPSVLAMHSERLIAGTPVVQRVYTNTELKVDKDAPGEDPAEVAKVIADWEGYAKRAVEHLRSEKEKYIAKFSQEKYDFKEKQLLSSEKLAGVFKNKLDSKNYDRDFVITRRDGDISALMIRKSVGKQTFLDDLMANPRKLYQITPKDAIAGQDDSASAAVEQVMREAVTKGGDIKLLGGDTTARSYWFKIGFGVMVPKKPHGQMFSA